MTSLHQDQNMNELDILANQFGSDKGTQSVNNLSPKKYTKVYYDYFKSFQSSEIKVLEIGIFEGASLKTWKSFFSKGEIYGIDINPECIKYEEERIKVYIGSQNDEFFLKSVVDSIEGKFDIIIDDGSHKMRDHQVSLKFLFPYLQPGGFYCIEDLHTAYWKGFGGGYRKKSSTIEYVKNIVDQLNRHSIKKILFYRKPKFEEVFDQVESIHFHQSLVLLKKKELG